jgi:hypothetical protein
MKKYLVVAAAALSLWGCGGSLPTTNANVPSNVVPLVNASFDLTSSGSIDGWEANEHNRGQSFSFVADTAEFASAPASAKIYRYGDEAWGLLRQNQPVLPAWLGKTARLTASLKSVGADSFGAGLVLQTQTGGDDILTHNHMGNARLLGNQGWTKYSIEIKIPPNAVKFNVGFMLEGGGTLWADDLKLEIID